MCEIATTRNPSEADEWLSPSHFAVLLGLLVVATFPGVLLLGQSFVLGERT